MSQTHSFEHTAFDHAVLVVNDLAAATRDYGALGFTVQPGGEHAGGYSHNALIGLADGGYLELFATVRPRHTQLLRVLAAAAEQDGGVDLLAADFGPVQARFMHSVAAGDGFADFALVSTALDADIARLRAHGIETEGPLPGERQRPDGQRLAWRFGLPGADGLPFLIDDVTERSLRAPAATMDAHPNGATGVAGVVVAVRELDAAVTGYGTLLGVEPQPAQNAPDLPAARMAHFPLGQHGTITLAQPTDEQSELAQHLAAHGQRPYLLRLYTNQPERAGLLDVGRAHGARVELIPATR